MPKRPQAGSAAAGSDADAKKAKPYVFMSSHAITIPPNTEPESPKLSAGPASQRAARKAEDAATGVVQYRPGEYEKFAEPFEAAVASACAEWGRPVTLNEVIIKMTKATGGKVKIAKKWKERFAWDGFNEGRWQISRKFPTKGQVAYPKGAAKPSRSCDWRFSQSPAARRPLAELGKLSK